MSDDIDHEGTFEYKDPKDVIKKHKSGQLSFHHAHRILTENWNYSEELSLDSLFDTDGTWDIETGLLHE